jgi:hypothetical protein
MQIFAKKLPEVVTWVSLIAPMSSVPRNSCTPGSIAQKQILKFTAIIPLYFYLRARWEEALETCQTHATRSREGGFKGN